MNMTDPKWRHYPLVFQSPRAKEWLQIQADLCLAPNTIEAYGRALNDYLSYCLCSAISPEAATKANVAAYVRDLFNRPKSISRNGNGKAQLGLANATIQQRLTVVRLYYDYLIDEGLRSRNPASKGQSTTKRGSQGQRGRNLLPQSQKLPWIPTDDQWQAILDVIKTEPIRNQLMLAFAYDGALRREELCLLETDHINPAYRLITLPAEITKNYRERIVPYSTSTSKLFAAYLKERRRLGQASGPLFLSESRRNKGKPISIWTWTKVVERVADQAGVPQFTTHTLRHLRLTDLARDGFDLNFIAQFAGHRNLETTQLYIHLSGREVAKAVQEGMSRIHAWRTAMMMEDFK